MPEFCFFPSDAEGRIQVFIPVLAVIYIKKITVVQFAMDKKDLGIPLRLRVLKVGNDLNSLHQFRRDRARVYLSFPEAVLAGAGTPHLIGDALELFWIVAQAR